MLESEGVRRWKKRLIESDEARLRNGEGVRAGVGGALKSNRLAGAKVVPQIIFDVLVVVPVISGLTGTHLNYLMGGNYSRCEWSEG